MISPEDVNMSDAFVRRAARARCMHNIDLRIVVTSLLLMKTGIYTLLLLENIFRMDVLREKGSPPPPPHPFSCYVLALMQMLFPPLLPPALVWCQAVIKDISGTGDTEA